MPRRHRVERVTTTPVPAFACALGLLLLAFLASPHSACAQTMDAPARQVTLFGVIASPDRKSVV